MKRSKKSITTKDLDKKFDKGEDISEYLDAENATRRINVDFPEWAIKGLDKERSRLGISRQALIKVWVVERLDELVNEKAKAIG